MKRPPRFALAIVLMVIVGSISVVLITWQVVSVKNEARDRYCERTATVRTDNRAMWLYLLENAPDTKRTRDFVKQLNEKLPPLKCTEDSIIVEDKEN